MKRQIRRFIKRAPSWGRSWCLPGASDTVTLNVTALLGRRIDRGVEPESLAVLRVALFVKRPARQRHIHLATRGMHQLNDWVDADGAWLDRDLNVMG